MNLNERQLKHMELSVNKLHRLAWKVKGIAALLGNQSDERMPDAEKLISVGDALEDYTNEINRILGGLEEGPFGAVGDGTRKSEQEMDGLYEK